MMNTALRFALIALLVAYPLQGLQALGQQQTTTSYAQPEDQRTLLATQSGNATMIFDVRPGVTSHQVTFVVGPSVSALTVTVTGSATGQNGSYAACGSSSTLGATITCSGTYNALKVAYTSFAGSGSIDATYLGVAQVSAAAGTQDVNIVAVGGNAVTTAIPVTDGAGAMNVIVDSGTLTAVTTITNSVAVRTALCTQTTLAKFQTVGVSDGAGTAVTATTSCIAGKIYVNNTSNSAVTLRLQDGAGTPVIWLGGNANYSIPANSNLGIDLEGVVFTTGITAIAGTTAVLNLYIPTLQ